MRNCFSLKGKKVIIKGTGLQGNYSIDEIIAIIPAAHIQKIRALVVGWYNPPKMYIDDGRVDFKIRNGKVVGFESLVAKCFLRDIRTLKIKTVLLVDEKREV